MYTVKQSVMIKFRGGPFILKSAGRAAIDFIPATFYFTQTGITKKANGRGYDSCHSESSAQWSW